ncbi:MAG: GntR family transcriptional regulator [bacterium]|nr:GntR family transcriptional regulator [bacterium]
MIVRIDFNSDEALYMQLYNQIIIGIANSEIREGENLPSVRDLADDIGINMHTVNKAYGILRQEGYLKLDRRRGAVIAIDADAFKAKMELEEKLKVLLAKAACRGVKREEIHGLIDGIYDDYGYE